MSRPAPVRPPRRALGVFCAAFATVAGLLVVVPTSAGADTAPSMRTFSADATYQVPVSGTYRIRAVGGHGGRSGYGTPGGAGAVGYLDTALTAGQVLRVEVGGDGGDGAFSETGDQDAGGVGGSHGGAVGGSGGGTTAFSSGGGGGGASSAFVDGALVLRIGGGGGGGGDTEQTGRTRGGDGGGDGVGGDGADPGTDCPVARGGSGVAGRAGGAGGQASSADDDADLHTDTTIPGAGGSGAGGFAAGAGGCQLLGGGANGGGMTGGAGGPDSGTLANPCPSLELCSGLTALNGGGGGGGGNYGGGGGASGRNAPAGGGGGGSSAGAAGWVFAGTSSAEPSVSIGPVGDAVGSLTVGRTTSNGSLPTPAVALGQSVDLTAKLTGPAGAVGVLRIVDGRGNSLGQGACGNGTTVALPLTKLCFPRPTVAGPVTYRMTWTPTDGSGLVPVTAETTFDAVASTDIHLLVPDARTGTPVQVSGQAVPLEDGPFAQTGDTTLQVIARSPLFPDTVIGQGQLQPSDDPTDYRMWKMAPLTTTIPVGTTDLVASYPGSHYFAATTSTPYGMPSSLQLSQTTATFGDTVTATVVISPRVGRARVVVNDTVGGRTTVVGGATTENRAVAIALQLSAGSHDVSATFVDLADPDPNSTPVGPRHVDVAAAVPAVALSADVTTVTLGHAVTLTAQLPAQNNGTVTFRDTAPDGQRSTVAAVAAAGGVARAQVTLPVGAHSLSADVPASADYLAATTAPVAVAVLPVAPTFDGTDPGLANLTVGVPFELQLAASGAPAPTFRPVSALPPGLRLTWDGLIQGVPTAVGQYIVQVVATNGTAPDATEVVVLVVGTPTLGVVGGGNQSAAAHESFVAPVVFALRDRNGAPLPGRVVSLTVTGPATSRGATSTAALTGADGTASFPLEAGDVPGAVTVTATAADADPVTVSELVTQAPPTTLTVVGGTNQRARTGAALTDPVRVRLTDSAGDPVPDVVVLFDGLSANDYAHLLTVGDGTVARVSTDADGYAVSPALVAPGGLGASVLRMSTPAFPDVRPADVTVSVVTGTPARLTSYGTIYGTVGDRAVLPDARVTDASGNPVGGVAVSWTTSASDVVFDGGATTVVGYTDVDGVAAGPVGIARTAPGSVTATVSSPDLTDVVVSGDIAPGPLTTLRIVGGQGQRVNPGQPFAQLTVERLDRYGNPTDGYPLKFQSSNPDIAAFEGGAVGYAGGSDGGLMWSQQLVAGSSLGGVTVTVGSFAAADPLQPVTFRLQVGVSQQVVFTSPTPTAPVVGSRWHVAASGGGSANPVRLVSATPSRCAVDDDVVIALHVGSCIVVANQQGSATYLRASSVRQQVRIGRAPQTLTVTSPPPVGARVGDTYLVRTASGGSPNPVQVSTRDDAVCAAHGDVVTMRARGTCQVRVSQAGDDDYRSAATVIQSFTVTGPRGRQP